MGEGCASFFLLKVRMGHQVEQQAVLFKMGMARRWLAKNAPSASTTQGLGGVPRIYPIGGVWKGESSGIHPKGTVPKAGELTVNAQKALK
jgi:hypothetical protein